MPIVMIENISRFVEEGMPRRQAALEGSKQNWIHHHLADISLIAVLIPCFHGRCGGAVIPQFAVTLAVSILISAFVSPDLYANDVRPDSRCRRMRKKKVAFCAQPAISSRGSRAVWTCPQWVLDHEKLTLLLRSRLSL